MTTPNSRYDNLVEQTNYAVDQVRAVAKWFSASIGAAAALLLAGVQLTSIGKVAWPKALTAGSLVLLVIGCSAWAILRLTDVLLPKITTRDEVVESATQGEFAVFLDKHRFLLANYASAAELAAAQALAVTASNAPGADDLTETEAKRLTETLNLLVPFGAYFAVRETFRTAKRACLVCSIIATFAILGYTRLAGS